MPSPTASPTIDRGAPPISHPILFPNPATDGQVAVDFNLRDASAWLRVEVFTTAFRKVNELDLSNLPAGPQRVTLPLTDNRGAALANGLYYVLVLNSQGRAIGKLLVLR